MFVLFFAVTPLVLAPLALLVMLFPTLIAIPLAIVRRWLVFLYVITICLALFTARNIFRGVRLRMDRAESWWGSPFMLWLLIALIAALGAIWIYCRVHRLKPADYEYLLKPRRIEQITLGLLSLLGVGAVLACILGDRPIIHPTLVVWVIVWSGFLNTLYLGWISHQSDRPWILLPTPGVMLVALAVASTTYGLTTFRNPAVSWVFPGYVRGTLTTSPVVLGERVYVTVNLQGREPHGDLYCIDRSTGRAIWVYGYQNDRELRSPLTAPCLTPDRIFVGEGAREANDDRLADSRLFCLDTHTGRTLWRYQTQGDIRSAANVRDGQVFFSAGPDGFICLDVVSGELRWHLRGLNVQTGPEPGDKHLYIGGQDADGKPVLVSVTAETGLVAWRTPLDRPVLHPPVLANNRLFAALGSSNGDSGGVLACFDPVQGHLLCHHELPDSVPCRPTVHGDRAYFASSNGVCHAIHVKTGSVVWRRLLGPTLSTSPDFHDNYLIGTSPTGKVYRLRAETGELVSEFDIAWHAQARAHSTSSPMVVDGQIFLSVTLDDLIGGRIPVLYCFRKI